MRPDLPAQNHSADERILADALVEVATELRLADPLEFLTMIRGNQDANIADLVNSSSELFFRSGSLRYGLAACCDLKWETTPSVGLDMEFRLAPVTVFFRLTIGRAHAGVEILDVLIDPHPELEGEAATLQLAQAIRAARLS
jgi:hypothetical protein